MLFVQCAALLASLATAVQSLDIPQSNHVKMDFEVLRGSSRSSARQGAEAALVKRQGSTELTLTNGQTYYAATLRLGSNGSPNSVIVDTGSSDLWVMSSSVSCTSSRRRSLEEFSIFSHRRLLDFEGEESPPTVETADKEKRADSTVTIVQSAVASQVAPGSGGVSTRSSGSGGSSCTASGSFNTAASNGFRASSSAPPFSISYADGTYARGIWGTDYIDFGSLNVSSCSFAVVNSTSSDTGVFGIGFASLETTYSGNSYTSPYTYQNFPLRLRSTGAIKRTLYSLYLNSADASSGSVLFGAVDHAKYSGTLQTVPIVNIYSSYYSRPIRFDIVLDSLMLQSSSQNVTVSTSHIPALLDSGTTLTYLPTAILGNLVSSMGGSYSATTGYYQVSCNYNTKSAFAVFNFSGVQIKVPMSDLILSTGSRCYLGVLGQSADSITGTPYAILGDNFLRNAYIVYDLEGYEISLAQVKYTTSENIEVVTSSVPSAVRAASYSATSLATSISGATSGSSFGSSSSSSNTRSSQGSKAFYFMRSLLLGAVAAGCLVYI